MQFAAPEKHTDCKLAKKCSNCLEAHSASDKNCQVYKETQLILRHQAENGGTFAGSRRILFPSGTTYSRVAKRRSPNHSSDAPGQSGQSSQASDRSSQTTDQSSQMAGQPELESMNEYVNEMELGCEIAPAETDEKEVESPVVNNNIYSFFPNLLSRGILTSFRFGGLPGGGGGDFDPPLADFLFVDGF